MTIIRRTAQGIARTKFGRRALKPNGDPNIFREKPPAKVIVGILFMLMSYVIGWPMIALLGVLSLHWSEPLIVILGGPLLFALAHAIFLAGLYLAGGRYFMPMIRWATRVTLRRFI
jgi:hypothetical protein